MIGGVLLAIVGLGGLYFFNLSRAAGYLDFYPGDLTGFSIQGISPVITLNMLVGNTSNVDFTINSMSAAITIDGTQVGTITNFTPARILRNSQGTLPLTITLQPIGVVNQLIGIITGGNGSMNLVIQGSVNANGIQAPILLPYKIGS